MYCILYSPYPPSTTNTGLGNAVLVAARAPLRPTFWGDTDPFRIYSYYCAILTLLSWEFLSNAEP